MKPELNGSSYYRANPFYQQGYLPDSAYKNRKQQNAGQLPQGEDFFEPTNKKHFQRLGYYSTIAEQQLMNSAVRVENQSPIKDKEYFRSLNVADIEGASTNTLISKAVKNRVKAQEELMKRAYEQREAERAEKMTSLEIMEEKRRKEALSRIKRAEEPNYHEVVKRMRTEEKEAIKTREMPQNIINQGSQNERNAQSDRMDRYRGQLDQTEKEIRQLQAQLSQVRKQRERAKTLHQSQNYQTNLESIAPVTYDQQYQNYQIPQHNYQQQINPEHYNQLPQKQPQQYQLSPYDQPSTPRVRNQNQENYRVNSPQVQQTEEKQERSSPTMAVNGRPTREEHRRFNPTYLSYFSPSISLAGKNIVGY